MEKVGAMIAIEIAYCVMVDAITAAIQHSLALPGLAGPRSKRRRVPGTRFMEFGVRQRPHRYRTHPSIPHSTWQE